MAQRKQTVSVIIPVRNRVALVMGTLRSVMTQSRQPDAVIVVDNASTDETAEAVKLAFRNWSIAEGHKKPRLVLVSEEKLGQGAARNRGLREADTDWVMFFDSDDEMLPNHINRAMTVAEQNNDAQIVGWNVMQEDHLGKRNLLAFYSADARFHNLFHGSMSTLRYMARTELFHKVGGWDESIPIWEDIELGSRLLNESPLIVKIAGWPTVVLHNFDKASVSGTTFTSRIGSYGPALESISRQLPKRKRHWIALKEAILAADIYREGSHAEAEKIYRQALAKTPSAYHRLILRLAYTYRRLGGKGAAQILRPFI